MKLRTMRAADYHKVYALWKATPGMGMRSLDDSEEGIKKFLKRNPKTCFVAFGGGLSENDGEIAGVILSGHDGRRGFIYHLAVRETKRGQEIGRALVDAAEKAMKAEGINKIALVAFTGNEQGNQFWEKMRYLVRDDLVYRNKSLNPENE